MKHMIKSLVLASLVATLPSFSQAEQIIVTKEVNNQNIPVSVAENKQNLSKANKETLLKENNQNSFKDIKQDSPKDNKE